MTMSALTSAERAETLELAFESIALRTICEKEAPAKHDLGEAVAELLKHRLSDLVAAKSVKDLVAGRPRTGTDQSCMVVDLGDSHRLIFKANHTNNPVTSSNELDWGKVTRVKILRIERSDA
jgi:hypothetical protein